jgi:transposase
MFNFKYSKYMENQLTKNRKKTEDSIEFEQVIDRGCGIDVHRDTVVVTIQGKDIATTTKTYSTFTCGLQELKVWLKENKITHVAMESTGVYWKPVVNILGEEFTILLVNARHIKNVPGHKTDKKDSKWLAKLLMAGLLKGSFIPKRTIRILRDLTRYRSRLTGMVTAEKNRFLKILEDTNIKLSAVLSDVFGASGRGILEAILENETYQSADVFLLVDRKVKAAREDILKALEGHLDEGHRYMLKTLFKHIGELEVKLKELDKEIARVSGPYQSELELLKTIPGVGDGIAVAIISEIGVDMEEFPSHKHLASWAGISPGNNESAGKNKSGRTTQGNKWLKTSLVEASWSASRSKDTYLQSKYRSLVRRKGPKKAIIALGHKILVSAYYILKELKSYKELGSTYLDKTKKDKLINFYKDQLAKLEESSNSLALA